MNAPVDVLAVMRETAIGLHAVADECTNSESAILMNRRAKAMDLATAAAADLLKAADAMAANLESIGKSGIRVPLSTLTAAAALREAVAGVGGAA